MSKEVHVEYVQPDGTIYCRWLDERTPLTGEHMDTYCMGECYYLAGSAQGTGVECLYDDTKPPQEG